MRIANVLWDSIWDDPRLIWLVDGKAFAWEKEGLQRRQELSFQDNLTYKKLNLLVIYI